jgi:hypothetical protein
LQPKILEISVLKILNFNSNENKYHSIHARSFEFVRPPFFFGLTELPVIIDRSMSPIQTKGDRLKSLGRKASGHFNSFFQSFGMNVAFPKTTSLKEESIIIMRNVKK